MAARTHKSIEGALEFPGDVELLELALHVDEMPSRQVPSVEFSNPGVVQALLASLARGHVAAQHPAHQLLGLVGDGVPIR